MRSVTVERDRPVTRCSSPRVATAPVRNSCNRSPALFGPDTTGRLSLADGFGLDRCSRCGRNQVPIDGAGTAYGLFAPERVARAYEECRASTSPIPATTRGATGVARLAQHD